MQHSEAVHLARKHRSATSC